MRGDGVPAETPVTVTCPCGQTVEHAQWCEAVPRLIPRREIDPTDPYNSSDRIATALERIANCLERKPSGANPHE